MAYHVEILRSGPRDAAIRDEEIETIIGGQFGFDIERNAAGAIVRMRRRTAHEDLVLTYEPPATLLAQNPDRAALQLMIEIAGALRRGASVRNDEYQTYLTVDQTYTHPDDAEPFRLKASPTPLRAVNWRAQLAKAPKIILLLALCYLAGRMLVAHFLPR